MSINFKSFGLTVEEGMRIAGYQHRQGSNDWVKWEGSGRFHAKLGKKKKGVSIHFDIYTSRKNHFAPRLDGYIKEEVDRINNLLSCNSKLLVPNMV